MKYFHIFFLSKRGALLITANIVQVFSSDGRSLKNHVSRNCAKCNAIHRAGRDLGPSRTAKLKKMGQRYSCETKIERKMAEFYRCAVGPQLHRIFTRNSRQVGVGIVHFVKSGYICQ